MKLLFDSSRAWAVILWRKPTCLLARQGSSAATWQMLKKSSYGGSTVVRSQPGSEHYFTVIDPIKRTSSASTCRAALFCCLMLVWMFCMGSYLSHGCHTSRPCVTNPALCVKGERAHTISSGSTSSLRRSFLPT